LYAKSVLWEAVYSLATSPDSIQDRLKDAGLALTKINEQNDGGLLKEHHAEILAIKGELSVKPAIGGEGNIAATTHYLTNEQGRKLAVRIFAIQTAIMGGTNWTAPQK
jgi:hypothetical protein